MLGDRAIGAGTASDVRVGLGPLAILELATLAPDPHHLLDAPGHLREGFLRITLAELAFLRRVGHAGQGDGLGFKGISVVPDLLTQRVEPVQFGGDQLTQRGAALDGGVRLAGDRGHLAPGDQQAEPGEVPDRLLGIGARVHRQVPEHPHGQGDLLHVPDHPLGEHRVELLPLPHEPLASK